MKRHAPFTAEEVENINRYQTIGVVHEMTCVNAHAGNRALVAFETGLSCPSCSYKQTWVPEGVAQFTQDDAARLLTALGGPTP